MKKLVTFAIALFAIGIAEMNAQSDYSFAAGLGFDFGQGATFVGPSAKYFFTEEHAGQAELMFESGITVVTALYEYHGPISGAEGLQWFAGGGPSIWFVNGGIGTQLALRPTAGLDYKINGVPLAFSFDWRPSIGISEYLGTEVGAFGLGIRYVIE
ncbi:hypothetical protein H0I23_03300 [Cellulophaga sp. HaHaR_3_176]|uniref:hypothetical protein n=1 Tax=Cellulophaga sp. HaHaR_3_176 TaxID=1942464 RepID=UPI001C1FFAAC|nr:hypothetical protein [Cellulophaga sp. HaHaR_3_176]QWX84686.1 hypothetical protein H0I23_03300 [Cellulophaga sp. HaHaR_3_176]